MGARERCKLASDCGRIVYLTREPGLPDGLLCRESAARAWWPAGGGRRAKRDLGMSIRNLKIASSSSAPRGEIA